MIKKFIYIFILLFASFIIGCGQIEKMPEVPDIPTLPTEPETPVNPEDPKTPIEPETPVNPDVPSEPEDETPVPVEFKTSIVLNGDTYIPSENENINVIWTNELGNLSAPIDATGFASMMLSGEYSVYLDYVPNGYTYNANIYKADNEHPNVEIELIKIAKTSKGQGTKLYNEYQITTPATYRAEIKDSTKKIFYEFQPKQAGYYSIQSIVNIHENMINPKIDTYPGSSSYKNFEETIDTGGAYRKGGYTKNFKWVVRLTEDMISSVFTFAVYGESKSGIFPIYIDFSITYEGEYYVDPTIASFMEAKEANFKTPEFNTGYKYYNADGGTGNYYGGYTNGSGVLNGDLYKYNEDTGYYHLFNSSTNEYGPILCAKITEPCAFYEEALSRIESHGNKNLTISDGKENYKQFIEVEYANACNSDGVCYVTAELKDFLQKFSISQRLFRDGEGLVETQGGFAVEDDHWLFACGYYVEIK